MNEARGGMCENPFGGEERIDRIDLMEFVQPNSPPEKVLYLCTIQDAASNYLYALLGKNGTSAEEFFAAWQYFFKINSTDKLSWDHHRTIKKIYTKQGKKVVENHYLTDNELKLMCFDQHYEMSGLAEYMNIDKFRDGLKKKRARVLNNNWAQVEAYVNSIHKKEVDQIASDKQIPLDLWAEDIRKTLIDPSTPHALTSLLYVPSKLKREKKLKSKSTNKGKYYQLAKHLKEKSLPALKNDWGPIADLLNEGV